MSQKYTYSDFFDADILKNLDALDKKLSGLHSKIQQFGKVTTGAQAKEFEQITIKASQYGKTLSSLNKQRQREEAKLAKERERAAAAEKKQTERFNLDAQKKNELVKLQASQVRNLAKAQITFQNAQKGSIDRIKAANRILNLKRNQLQIGTKRYEAYTRAILRNENALKKYDSQVGRSQRHVGAYERALGGVQKGFSIFTAKITAALIVFRQLWRGIQKSIELYQIQEQAIADNEQAFGAYSRIMQNAAADIQKVTTVGDEAVLALQTQARNFGIAIEDVNNATQGAIGLSEKFKNAGLSTEAALKGIANAYAGNFSQLERYIPALREATTEAEKMEILQREMAEGFNLAKESAKTSGGQMQQLKNEYGDLQEMLGELIIPIVMKLVSRLRELIERTQYVIGVFTRLRDFLVGQFEDVLDRINIKSGRLSNIMQKVGGSLKMLYSPVMIFKSGMFIIKQIDRLIGGNEELAEVYENVKDVLTELGEEERKIAIERARGLFQSFLDGEIKSIDALKTALSELFAEYAKTEVQGIIDEEDVISENIKDKALEAFLELQKIEAEHFQYSILQRKRHNKDIEYLELDKKEFQLRQQKELFQFMSENNKNLAESEVLAMQNLISALQVEINELYNTEIPDTLGLTNAIENELNDFKVRVGEARAEYQKIWKLTPEEEEELKSKLKEYANVAFQEIQAISKQRIDFYDKEIEKLNELINKDEDRLDKELKSIEEKKAAGVAYSRQNIENIKDEIQANREKEKKILEERNKTARRAKAIAISEVIANTAVAVASALKLKFPLNLIVAGVVGAAGAVQIGKVQAQQFAEGTEYVDDPKAPRGKDTIWAKLDRGERVVPTKENKKIPRNFPNYLLADAVNHYLVSNAKKEDYNLAELQQQTGFLEKIANQKETKYNAKGQKTFEKIGNTTNIYV